MRRLRDVAHVPQIVLLRARGNEKARRAHGGLARHAKTALLLGDAPGRSGFGHWLALHHQQPADPAAAALGVKASRTLEIGLAVGGSCLVFTQTRKDLGAIPERQHVAIDPFQRSNWIDEAGLLAIERRI